MSDTLKGNTQRPINRGPDPRDESDVSLPDHMFLGDQDSLPGIKFVVSPVIYPIEVVTNSCQEKFGE